MFVAYLKFLALNWEGAKLGKKISSFELGRNQHLLNTAMHFIGAFMKNLRAGIEP